MREREREEKRSVRDASVPFTSRSSSTHTHDQRPSNDGEVRSLDELSVGGVLVADGRRNEARGETEHDVSELVDSSIPSSPS